jgi:hypothetical protein
MITVMLNGETRSLDPVFYPSMEQCLHMKAVFGNMAVFKHYGAKLECITRQAPDLAPRTDRQ